MGQYDDIINLPHHQSETRPHMSMYARAAQFSPYAALVGYGEAVSETARLTDSKIEFGEGDIITDDLNAAFQFLQNNPGTSPKICVTYFVPDARKEGGAYKTYTGNLKRLNEAERVLVFKDKTEIPYEDIYQITILTEEE